MDGPDAFAFYAVGPLFRPEIGGPTSSARETGRGTTRRIGSANQPLYLTRANVRVFQPLFNEPRSARHGVRVAKSRANFCESANFTKVKFSL